MTRRTLLVTLALLLVSAIVQAQVPTWMKDAVIYQVFPERFRNGNTANDPAGTVPWLSAPTTGNYFGGDLQGVIDKINAGYFTDLGINTIYFNPIFKATSNHGYNTGDYYNVDPRFGNNALFDTLISTASSHNIRIVLDAVFNHAGDDSKYMDAYHQWPDVGACESAASVYRPWFVTGSQGTGCDGDWHWNGWAGYSTIPEFAEIDPVKAFFYRGGSPQSPGGVSVTEYWLSKGISGWRFDVAIDISHAWWQDLRPYVKNTHPQAVLIGEVWPCDTGSGSPTFLQGNELDSDMNYCFRDWAIAFANGGAPSGFNNSYNNLRGAIPSASWYAMMNLVGSHDTARILDQLGSNKLREKLIALLQMTLPGAPSIYYGDEVGLPGGNDPDDRRAYPWADLGGNPDTDLYAYYKRVIGLRNANSALRGGTMNSLLTDDGQNLYAYVRTDASQRVVVILNNGGVSRTAVVNVSAYVANGTVMTDLMNGNAPYTVSGGNVTVPVTSLGAAVLRDCATCPTPTPVPQTPYGGTAWAVPGTIQAENYDVGGEGVAYHDLEAVNQGGQYRTAEGVDIEATTDTGGGYNLGWTRTDEWVEYTVNVAASGSYTLTERVASGATTGQFRVELGGVDKTGTVVVPNTGGFQTWTNLSQTVSLSAGVQILRIYFLGNDTNLNYISLSSNGPTPTTRPTATATATPTPTVTVRPTATATSTSTVPTATATATVTATTAATIVDLSSAFNVNAAYTDGTTFPSTGGLDGVGSAYSSTLLGSSLTWSSTTFSFGAANQLNAARNKTLTLPAGQFATLLLLGTAVNGDQTSQTVRVSYTDGTSSSFTQTFSNWLNASQNVAGQQIAKAMAYRNKSTGVKDNRAFNLYGYTFALDKTKTVSSLVLPATNNVSILAATLRN